MPYQREDEEYIDADAEITDSAHAPAPEQDGRWELCDEDAPAPEARRANPKPSLHPLAFNILKIPCTCLVWTVLLLLAILFAL